MRFSDQLLDQIRERKKTFRIDVSNRDAVIRNLRFIYDCCIASEDLLAEASKEAKGKLSEYYSTHLIEESGEICILEEDLMKTQGVEEPNLLAMGLIGTQYYLVNHVHPVSLLGYMAVQEADPTPIEVVEQLELAHGKELFRFIRMHAIRDLEHRKELIEVIDTVSEKEQRIVVLSARITLDYLELAMKEIYG